MSVIPIHRAVDYTDSGIRLKRIVPGRPAEPVEYFHRDDYYVFGVVTGGCCRLAIDFRDCELRAGEAMVLRPGQVHRLLEARELCAWMLFVDEVFVAPADEQLIAEYALCPGPVPVESGRLSELDRLFELLDGRREGPKSVVQHLAAAAVGMLTQLVGARNAGAPKNRRDVEITLSLRSLLSEEACAARRASYYAQRLCVSPGYLNEAVKRVTGESVSSCIRTEMLMRARRALIYTSESIREIAFDLGLEDPDYFTRLFTKSVGVTPSVYRRTYLVSSGLNRAACCGRPVRKR